MSFFSRLFPKFAHKDRVIKETQKEFHKNIDKDIARMRKINKKLDNGLALKIYKANHHHGH